ncbi:prolyl oligopeptidase family serine peptidase [Yinghuangia sp. YIM S09857]|uniref:prolyl oligopeptidase family serine peptidase n=1 Tax=Yinghuangia sp. YIM S09857 TaxID=3436929 RepID=UPI003F5317AE
MAEDGRKSRRSMVLDPKDFAPGMLIRDFFPSPDNRLVAVQVLGHASESHMFVYDIEAGRFVDGPIDRCRFSHVTWTSDSSRFLYTRLDSVKNPLSRRLFLHTVGRPATEDVDMKVPVVADAEGELPNLGRAYLSNDGTRLVVMRSPGTGTRTAVLSTALEPSGRPSPGAGWSAAYTHVPAEWHLMAEHDGMLYLIAQDRRDRGAIYRVSPDRVHARDEWEEFLPEDPNPRTVLTQVHVVGTRGGRSAVLVARATDAESVLTVHSADDGALLHTLKPPTGVRMAAVASVSSSGDDIVVKWDATGYKGTTAHRLDSPTPSTRLWAVKPELAMPPPRDDLEVLKIPFQPAGDVPAGVMYVSRIRGRAGKSSPVLVTGYGQFGLTTAPEASPGIADMADAWREAGGTWVTFCLPGGGDLGQKWYLSRQGPARDLALTDWENGTETLRAEGIIQDGPVVAFSVSGPGAVLAELHRRNPELLHAVVMMAPMVALPPYPENVTDASKMWDMGPGDLSGSDAFKQAALHGFSHADRYFIVAWAQQDDRVGPELHGEAWVKTLKEHGIKHESVVSAVGGHQHGDAPATWRARIMEAMARAVDLEPPPTASQARSESSRAADLHQEPAHSPLQAAADKSLAKASISNLPGPRNDSTRSLPRLLGVVSIGLTPISAIPGTHPASFPAEETDSELSGSAPASATEATHKPQVGVHLSKTINAGP